MRTLFRAVTAGAAVALAAMLTPSAAGASDGAAKPVFEIQRVYLKSMELKQPNSPAMFLQTEAPTIALTLKTESTKVAADTYEVWVSIFVTAHVKEKLAFSVSAKQAGIFNIKNVPVNQMAALQGIGCPNIIYPYLRANIADVITRAGFPPVHLSEINWEVHYEQQKKLKK